MTGVVTGRRMLRSPTDGVAANGIAAISATRNSTLAACDYGHLQTWTSLTRAIQRMISC